MVRNGHAPEREIQTGIGPIEVRRPKVRDRGDGAGGERIRFTSKVLPPFLRRTKNVEELLPWLYLKGVSTGQFEEALAALLGPDAPGLSASTVRRLVASWQQEHERWQGRDLSTRRYVYVWADGVYFTPRLDHDRQCILVLIGADADGRKELLAIEDGYRESAQSWRELLLRLRDENGLAIDARARHRRRCPGLLEGAARGLADDPPAGCWVHKTANVLNALPKSVHGKAKKDLHAIYEAESRADAEAAFDRFIGKYGAKYDRAVTCLAKDREALLGLLRLPGRALEARAHLEPDREHLRHRAAADRQDQGLPLTRDGARHGLQARQVGRAPLAPAGRRQPPRPAHRGRPVPRWRARSRRRGASRRLTLIHQD